MYVDLVPWSDFNTNWVNYAPYLNNTNIPASEWQWRSNYWSMARNLQHQLFDLRLTFRWPLSFNGTPGNERQAYRTLAGGMLSATNDSGNAAPTGANIVTNYFLEPRLYALSTNGLTGRANQFFPFP